MATSTSLPPPAAPAGAQGSDQSDAGLSNTDQLLAELIRVERRNGEMLLAIYHSLNEADTSSSLQPDPTADDQYPADEEAIQ